MSDQKSNEPDRTRMCSIRGICEQVKPDDPAKKLAASIAQRIDSMMKRMEERRG